MRIQLIHDHYSLYSWALVNNILNMHFIILFVSSSLNRVFSNLSLTRYREEYLINIVKCSSFWLACEIVVFVILLNLYKRYKYEYCFNFQSKYDVKNGKFLCAKKNNQSKITCELDNGKQSNIECLNYMHWNIKAEYGIVKMFADEKKTDDNIKVEEVYRTTLTLTEGDCERNY